MRLSPINSNNCGNIFKSGLSSKTFNAGTAELLSNVLNIPNPYDYQSQDGDTLLLSQSSKKRLTQEEVLAVVQKSQSSMNSMPSDRIPQTVKDFFATYHGEVGMKAENLDDTAQNLVNSLFVSASSQNSINSNDDLLKKVMDSLHKTFEGLVENSGNLPPEVKDDLKSIYDLAKLKIDQWASAKGIKTATDSWYGVV